MLLQRLKGSGQSSPSMQSPFSLGRHLLIYNRFEGNIVTLVVGTGDQVQSFTVHETLIKEQSGYFCIAFDKLWNEKQSPVMDLPEDEPGVVSTYLDFLYGKEVPMYLDEDRDADFARLAQVYVFGEKIEDDKFCDSTMIAMCRGAELIASDGQSTYKPGSIPIATLYAGTPRGSPARLWAVHCYAKGGTHGISMLAYPKDFHSDLIEAVMGAGWDNGPYERRKEWFKQQ